MVKPIICSSGKNNNNIFNSTKNIPIIKTQNKIIARTKITLNVFSADGPLLILLLCLLRNQRFLDALSHKITLIYLKIIIFS